MEIHKKSDEFTGNYFSAVDHEYILFSSDFRYMNYKVNSLIPSTIYSLRKTSSIYASRKIVYKIEVDYEFIGSHAFSISGNILFIRDEMHDGFTGRYERLYTEKQTDKFFKKNFIDKQ